MKSGLGKSIGELLASMRFAISVLVVIAIASMVGTVLQQNQSSIAYVDKFGPFWAEVFDTLGLQAIYGAGWFYALLAFLIASVSMCVVRNAPKFIREARDMRVNLEERSLPSFHLRFETGSAQSLEQLEQSCAEVLRQRRYTIKRRDSGDTVVVAAKSGSASRYGYIAAHCAIVVLALCYLLDTNLPLRAQMLVAGKTPVSGNLSLEQVPASARFGPGNFSFRGSMLVPESQQAGIAILNYRDRVFVQDLPFTLTLKRFIVEYYPTGMPRMFRSEVTLRDNATGATQDAGIEVNKPLIHDGIAIYQASFDDGGSGIDVSVVPLAGPSNTRAAMTATVGDSLALPALDGVEAGGYQVEFTGLRVINVENLGSENAKADEAGRSTADRFRDNVANVMSSTHGDRERNLRNVGPSFTYRLRGPDGVAREFQNYMAPVQLDGRAWFLMGMRDTPGAAFRFLRIPVDQNGSIDAFLRLRAALQDPVMRAAASRRYADSALAGNQAALRQPLEASAQRTLELFASGGFEAVAAFLDRSVPEGERANAAQVFLRILGGSLRELHQLVRDPRSTVDATVDDDWVQAAVNSLSDTFLFGAPVALRLDNFRQVQASVFQLTRAPGKNIVYLGCLMLVIGIFSMFFLPERRVWIWLRRDPHGTAPVHLSMAMSAPRRSIDLDREFDQLRGAIASAT
ncbi:cytochrome c biogenesis protein ResB [soil metagenome]